MAAGGRQVRAAGGAVRLFAAIAVAAAVAACSPVVRHHGYAPDEFQLAMIEVGRDNREAVVEVVGFPGVTGLVTDDIWYYVKSRRVHGGIGEPPEESREVVAISFDARDVVSNIERFGLEDGQVVALSRRVTESNVPPPSILSQLLRNIGVFQPSQFFD